MDDSFEYERTVETSASPAAVWALWQDTSAWPTWDESITAVEMNGPFEVGTAGTMHLTDGMAVPFTLTEITPGVGFADRSELPGLVLRFTHRVTPSAGGATVTLRVDVEGEQAAEVGPAVAGDIPESLAGLVAHAERRDRASSSA